MSNIPLDLERRCEQRWAARFSRPNPPTAPNNHELERQDLDRLSAMMREAAKPTVLISEPSNGTEKINTARLPIGSTPARVWLAGPRVQAGF
jgi:hypothetical protein